MERAHLHDAQLRPGTVVVELDTLIGTHGQCRSRDAAGLARLRAQHRRERLRWFRKRIRTNPEHPRTVGGLARLAELTPTWFSTVWRRQFGVSPQDDLIQARLDRACQLLGEAALSVARVAQACGYADPLYFSRLFRKRIGRSPSDFARQRTAGGGRRRR